MKHLGILAHSVEGAALCLRAFCQEGFAELGPHDHPDVTLDCIALARSMPAWDEGDHRSIRATLAVSVRRLADAGADFFVCPDNTAHMALEEAGPQLALPGLHIAEVVADGSRQRYVRIIEQLAARGCDAVALVCTEIPLLVRPEDSPLPTLDSTRLLARAAFDVAVSHRALPTWRGGPLGPDGIPLDDAAPVG
jgi:aspartate/glutamate racemase